VSLALEVKPFVNSEHTGEYVEIQFPLSSSIAPEKAPKRKSPRKAAKEAAPPVTEEEGEAAAEAAPEAPPTPRFECETIRLHYMEAGFGEPLLLVHTVGQSMYTWRGQFQRLSEYYRVIAVDLVGHGYSQRAMDFSYSMEDHVESLRLLLDALNIQSAHLVGFSIGGMYALEFLRKYPARCGRALVINPGGITQEMPLMIRMMDNALFGGIASRLFGIKTVRTLLEESCFDLTVVTDEVVREYFATACDPGGRRAIQQSIYRYEDEALLAQLRGIDKPVCILHGEEDKWHTMEETKLMRAALPDVVVKTVRNCGHLLHEEKPDKLITAILEHIPVVVE